MATISNRRAWLIVPVCALAAATCGEDSTGPSVPEVSLAELESAPDTLEVSGIRLTLWTYLWRDFQPVSPPDGKPLIALIRLVEPDSVRIPPALTPRYIWVLNGGQVWASRFSEEERPPRPEWEIERVARDGPKWGPGIEVDVVVGIPVSEQEIDLVAARNQPIYRTD